MIFMFSSFLTYFLPIMLDFPVNDMFPIAYYWKLMQNDGLGDCEQAVKTGETHDRCCSFQNILKSY